MVDNQEEIKNQFDKVITYSQGIHNPKTDNLFRVWSNAKKDIINAFGGKLIYEFPEKVSFELGEKEKIARINDFIDKVILYWNSDDLADFIDHQKDGFFKNLTTEDYSITPEKVIKKGTKLVKAFKYFVDSERSLTDIQNEASRIIQEDKIEGTLCLSVHPLDYLSSSENTYNWRSCHALDGEYRAGNLSYMMDSSTIVCYLKGADNVKLPNFPEDVLWNSKKWRMLLFLSNDWNMMFAGRQYPFFAKAGLDFILKEVLPNTGILEKNNKERAFFTGKQPFWTNWTNTKEDYFNIDGANKISFESPYIPIGKGMMPLDHVVYDAEGSKQYNDLLYSNCYTPYYSIKAVKTFIQENGCNIELTTNKKTHFEIGNYTYCLECGKAEVSGDGETMRCYQCEYDNNYYDSDSINCSCCGNRYELSEGHFMPDGDFLCENCYNEYVTICDKCGEEVYNEDIRYDPDTE